jgi:hypothetical protein
MIRKQLNIAVNNFTHADLKSISENGTVSCDMLIIEVDEEGNETEVYREGFTSYDEGNYPFEFTQEDIELLNPKIQTDETI